MRRCASTIGSGYGWVHLDADAMGIFVWPSFGLDFDKRSQKEQMIALLRRSEVEPLPDPMGLVAPEVLSIVLEDDRDGSATKDSGARFLRELGRLIGEGGDTVPMTLDLRAPTQRAILQNSGILGIS